MRGVYLTLRQDHVNIFKTEVLNFAAKLSLLWKEFNDREHHILAHKDLVFILEIGEINNFVFFGVLFLFL